MASCKEKTKPEQAENKPTDIPVWKVDLDTVLERNNPKNLDLFQTSVIYLANSVRFVPRVSE